MPESRCPGAAGGGGGIQPGGKRPARCRCVETQPGLSRGQPRAGRPVRRAAGGGVAGGGAAGGSGGQCGAGRGGAGRGRSGWGRGGRGRRGQCGAGRGRAGRRPGRSGWGSGGRGSGPGTRGVRRGVRQRGGRGQAPDLDPAGQGGRQGITGAPDGRPGRGGAQVQDARVPWRHSGDPDLAGRAAVVAGPGEDLGHDRRRAAHGLAGEFRLDGPALAGPRRCRPGRADGHPTRRPRRISHGFLTPGHLTPGHLTPGHPARGCLTCRRPGRIRPVHLPVGQVLAERHPAAHPGPQAALAAPVRPRGGVPGRGFQRHPDRGDSPQVREAGQCGRRRPVRQPAGEEPGPGQPDPGAARPEAGRVSVTLLPPARREGPCPDLADPQPDS